MTQEKTRRVSFSEEVLRKDLEAEKKANPSGIRHRETRAKSFCGWDQHNRMVYLRDLGFEAADNQSNGEDTANFKL